MQGCLRPAGCFGESLVKPGWPAWPLGIERVPLAQEYFHGPVKVCEIPGPLNKQVPVGEEMSPVPSIWPGELSNPAW